MNILVWTEGGNCISRPDTTWKRDDNEFYVPEDVSSILYTPALVARVDRPGKAVGINFAGRYYSLVSPAVLIYPMIGVNKGARHLYSVEGLAAACCMDRTSFFPFPVLDRGVKGIMEVKGSFSEEIDSAQVLDSALVGVTGRCYLRSGDLFLAELSPRTLLSTREDGCREVQMSFCGVEYGFDIIY